MENVLLICSFFLLVITSIRCVFVKSKKFTDVLLNATLISLIFNCLSLYLFFTEKLPEYIHLYRLGTLFTSIFISSIYLYVKYSLNKKAFNSWDLLFFLPAFIYLIDYLPFLLSSSEHKRTAFFSDLQNGTFNLHLQSSFIPNGTHFLFQNALGVVLSLSMLYHVFQAVRQGGKYFFRDNKSLVIWFTLWAVLLFFSTLPDFLKAATDIKLDLKEYIFITPCILFYLSLPVSLLLLPELLYGTRGFWVTRNPLLEMSDEGAYTMETGANIEIGDILSHSSNLLRQVRQHDTETPEEKSKARNYYDKSKAESMKNKLDLFMRNSEIFTNHDLSIQDIAAHTEFSVRQISSLLNNYAKVSFKDYVNSYRIKAFIEFYKKEEQREKTMENLCTEFGFSNRHTFLHAFKKQTGLTPSAFFSAKSDT